MTFYHDNCHRKADYYRYLAESKTGNEKKEIADKSLKVYQVIIDHHLLRNPCLVIRGVNSYNLLF